MADLSQVSTEDLLKLLQGHASTPAQPEIPEGHRVVPYGFTDEAIEQGVMLGYGDEAMSGMTAGLKALGNIIHGNAPNIGSEYEKELAIHRAERDAWEKAHPFSKYVAPIIGGLGAASPVKAAQGVAAVAPTIRQVVTQGAKAGAGIGAVAGFGAGEGGLENRLESAGGGALTGAAIGAAAPLAVEGTAAAVRAGKAVFGLTSPEERATAEIGTALSRSGRTADEVSQAVQQAQALGVPAVPADTTLSLRRLGRAVETVPGQASEAVTRLLEERQTGQGERVGAQIKRALGNEGDVLRTADQLIADRAAAAKPLYEKAYEANAADMNAAQLWNPKLEALMSRPAMRQAWGRAKTIIANEGGNPNTLGIKGYELPAGEFGSYGVNKKPILGDIPTMQGWDYIKRGLDDVLEKYRNPITGKLQLDEAGRAIAKTKAEFVNELDAINPTYAQARQTFAGHSDMLDALHQGQDFWKGDSEISARRFNELSDSEKDMFRIGAVKQLRTLIENTPDGADITKRLFGTPGRRTRIAMLFKDPQEFQVFSRIMDLERETTKTNQLVRGGSPTGRIAAEQADLFAGAVEDAVLHRLSPTAMATNFARRMLMKAKGINEETAQRIAGYLFNPNPGAAQQPINPQAVQDIINASRRRAGITGMASRGLTQSLVTNNSR